MLSQQIARCVAENRSFKSPILKWLGLKILATEEGQSTDKKGIVEFVASFEQNGIPEEHHERSRFRKDENGQWFFVDGDSLSSQGTLVRTEAKIG